RSRRRRLHKEQSAALQVGTRHQEAVGMDDRVRRCRWNAPQRGEHLQPRGRKRPECQAFEGRRISAGSPWNELPKSLEKDEVEQSALARDPDCARLAEERDLTGRY